MSQKLNNWRKSATRRAEFAAMLQEPCMQDAIEIVKEIIFTPINPPVGMGQLERMAYFGEMGLRREAYLGMLKNFMGLALLEPLKGQAKELQKAKPWETADRAAGELQILKEFYSGSPPPLEGETGATGTAETERVLPVTPEPQTSQE